MNKKDEIEKMMILSNEFYKISGFSQKSVLTYTHLEMIPVIVNCAFSIELSLKSLYYAINNQKVSKEHNLKILYNAVKSCGLESFLLTDFSQNEINKIIDELENAFVEYRYLYEQNKILTIHPSLLKDFIKYVNSYCNDYIKKYNKK